MNIPTGLEDLESALKNNQAKPATVNVPEAAEVLAVRSDLPTQPVELVPEKIRRIEVKFNFSNEKHIPREIPQWKRDQSVKVGEHSANLAYSLGHQELAEFERHRKGAYDTGEPVVNDLKMVQVSTLRRGFTNIGMLLTGCFYYEQQKPGQMKKWIVVLRFGWEQVTTEHQKKAQNAVEESARAAKEAEDVAANFKTEMSRDNWLKHKKAYDRAVAARETAIEAVRCLQTYYKPGSIEFNTKTAEMLRSLARVTWGHCFVWKNPDASVTVNMLHRSPDRKPDFALAVRNRKLAVLDVKGEVEESQE